MPRYNVKYNGKWACFTSVSDGFVSKFMSKTDYNTWSRCEYKLDMTMEEAVSSIRIYNSHKGTVEQLVECDLQEDEAEKIVYAIETEYYVPILEEDRYKCPNCGSEVEKGQVVCKEETCELKFVWRD